MPPSSARAGFDVASSRSEGDLREANALVIGKIGSAANHRANAFHADEFDVWAGAGVAPLADDSLQAAARGGLFDVSPLERNASVAREGISVLEDLLEGGLDLCLVLHRVQVVQVRGGGVGDGSPDDQSGHDHKREGGEASHAAGGQNAAEGMKTEERRNCQELCDGR